MASVASACAVPVTRGRNAAKKSNRSVLAAGHRISARTAVAGFSGGAGFFGANRGPTTYVSGARRTSKLRVEAVNAAKPSSKDGLDEGDDKNLEVSVDGSSDKALTIVSVKATNRPGILQLMQMTLEDLSLNVERTEVDMDGDLVSDTFYVTSDDGSKVDDPYDLANIERVIKVVLHAHYAKSSGHPRPEDRSRTMDAEPRKKDLLYSLMDNYIKNDVLAIQKSVVEHVEYTLGRSRYRFDDFEAYQVRARPFVTRVVKKKKQKNTKRSPTH